MFCEERKILETILLSVMIVLSGTVSMGVFHSRNETDQDYTFIDAGYNSTTSNNIHTITIGVSLIDAVQGYMYTLFTHPNDSGLQLKWGQSGNGGQIIVTVDEGTVLEAYSVAITACNSKDCTDTVAVYLLGGELRSAKMVGDQVLEARVTNNMNASSRGFIFNGNGWSNRVYGTITYW